MVFSFPEPRSSRMINRASSSAQESPMPSSMNSISRTFVSACLFTGLFTGCRSATAPDSVLPKFAGNEPEQQLDYWHTIATKSLISNDEAFHGLLLYLDGADNAQSYGDRVAMLK